MEMAMEMSSFINSYMNTLEKAELAASLLHSERFSKSEYRFTVLKSRTRLAEKQQQEEHRQLKTIKCFTQTQKIQSFIS